MVPPATLPRHGPQDQHKHCLTWSFDWHSLVAHSAMTEGSRGNFGWMLGAHCFHQGDNDGRLRWLAEWIWSSRHEAWIQVPCQWLGLGAIPPQGPVEDTYSKSTSCHPSFCRGPRAGKELEQWEQETPPAERVPFSCG